MSDTRLSLIRKILFGLAAPPLPMSSSVLSFYFTLFMLEVAKLPPALTSVILMGGRVWDAVTDPVVGQLVARTNTRFGKTRPWMALSSPVTCAVFLLLWVIVVPVESDNMALKFVYYLVIYLLYSTAVTCYHIPLTSSVMRIAQLPQDKEQATAFRIGFELISTIAGVTVFGQITTSKRIAASCGSSSGPITPERVQDERQAYLLGAACIAAVCFFSGLVATFGIRERFEDSGEGTEADGFVKNMKAVLTFRPYVILMLAFMFLALGVQLVQSNLALYITHSLDLGGDTNIAIVSVLMVAILSTPLWSLLSGRLGKKFVFSTGVVVLIPILLAAMCLPPGNRPALYITMTLAGLSISVASLLPWSMLPDVIDAYHAIHGCRREASFFSLYVFFNKFVVGVSIAASQLALAVAGYDSSPEVCEQSDSVGTALRILFGPGPIVCLLAALLLITQYPINDRSPDPEELQVSKM